MVTIRSQSFESETSGDLYTNDATDGNLLPLDAIVDIANNPGQATVDAANLSGALLGFDATWQNTRSSTGLSDGDFVGVTTFTGEVGSFTDGVQGYRISDPDGKYILTFDTVDVSDYKNVSVSLDYFLSDTTWESNDVVTINVVTDAGSFTILDSTGLDIDDLNIEGTFVTGTQTIPETATTAQLVVTLDSNTGAENLYVDNILFEGEATVPEPQLVISEIMYAPASNEDAWEWVEVFNGSDETVDLSGYVLDDNDGATVSSVNIASGTIGAGETAILYNADDLTAADFTAAWGEDINLVAVTDWSQLGLDNTGDTVGLWSSFTAYQGNNETQTNALVSVTYDGSLGDGTGSIYLTDLTDPDSFALSTEDANTPAGGAVYVSAAAAGNSGMDIGSPGGTLDEDSGDNGSGDGGSGGGGSEGGGSGNENVVAEILDLTGIDGNVTANVSLMREAAFDNLLQFYITDANGAVDGINPGEAGYEDAVRQNLLAMPQLFVENQMTQETTITLEGGFYYAPALVIDGDLQNLGTIGDAAMGMTMIQRSGDVWMFEDWVDADFNDLKFTIDSVAVTPIAS